MQPLLIFDRGRVIGQETVVVVEVRADQRTSFSDTGLRYDHLSA